MKATVFHGPRDVRVETVADPKIKQPADAIVRVVNAAICGSDLWPYRGIATTWEAGFRLGHEFIGVIEELGSEPGDLRKGAMVAAPFSYNDGTCDYCHDGIYTSCRHGGFWGGGDEDGGQGQFVRVPYAAASLRPIPDAVAHDPAKRASALALTDVMSTGHHGAVRANVRAGGTAAVIGDGAVGLCAIISAKRSKAERIIAIGHHAGRLELARRFGATDIVDSNDTDAAERIIEMTNGGVQSVVEAVGSQSTLNLGVKIARAGGIVSYVGVPYGVETFDARRLFSDNISIAGALAPTRAYIDELMADVVNGTIDPSPVFSLRLPLERSPDGYAAMDKREAIKVLLEVSAPS
ncbi:MAG: zinc-dependent alcohol dehydrogenase family protein [Candidatus Velthaea sp.]